MKLSEVLWMNTLFYEIVSFSMQPTLRSGDLVVCSKFSLKIKRGDIIVFRESGGSYTKIKRVVAIPGDDITYRGKTLIVNSMLIEKRYISDLGPYDVSDVGYTQSLFGKAFSINESYFGTYHKVSKSDIGGYFLLGDNRDHSTDSRHFGLMPKSSFLCKAKLVYRESEHTKSSLPRLKWL
ncbi:signal peptidase I [Microbulbifer sp. OS29]|uniref:Signal peptidase I n=1 Tax=Microbulbifer okhotskensis TaxID=2926617 RepID=A0A9X2ESB8_9GAMM|nr:signal peptidase I [Microbulbifer okhotskensis]MCO1336896.1 signal peptidase I [Microbulbifer okhotskensis]